MSGRRLAVAGAVAGLLLLCGAVASAGSHWYRTSDFFCLWTAARFVDTGVDPYDRAAWQAATGGIYPDLRGGLSASSCPGRYGYPLWTAVATAPFGLLPLEPSAILWMALSIGATIAGVAWSWRAFGGSRRFAALLAAIVVASQPFWILLISGQISGIALGLAGLGAYLFALRRAAAGGAALTLLALKPQIAGVLAVILAARALLRRRAILIGGVAGLGPLFAVSLALQPGWPAEWMGEIAGRRVSVAALLPTAWGLSATVLGTVWPAVPMLILLVVAVRVLVGRHPVSDEWIVAIGLPLSLFATPYAWSYDHLVLAVSWAAVLAVAARSTARLRWALLGATVLLASVLPWILYAVAFTRGDETLSAVIPALTAALTALALRCDMRRRVSPG